MIDINHTIQHSGAITGLLIIGGIIVTEAGIPVGFFLPGDTLLFTAGFFASQHYIPIWGLIPVAFAAQVIGSNIGYQIGLKAGRKLFERENSFFFRKDYLDSAEAFYEKHGGKTVLFGKFIPVVRTFAPIVAGISAMNRKIFNYYNVVGALIWATLVSLLGYWLGKKVHNIDKYLLPIIIAATIFSFTPAAWHLFGKRDARKRIVKNYRDKKELKASKKVKSSS